MNICRARKHHGPRLQLYEIYINVPYCSIFQFQKNVIKIYFKILFVVLFNIPFCNILSSFFFSRSLCLQRMDTKCDQITYGWLVFHKFIIRYSSVMLLCIECYISNLSFGASSSLFSHSIFLFFFFYMNRQNVNNFCVPRNWCRIFELFSVLFLM